ncbi:MAG: glycerophosphodiester phosphodiesterase [Idiomarina sp.]|nr:glycerophosphodiester phosphodiesterase [Idiomarina sp.]
MILWAHRGASYEAPENTLAAFTRAMDSGVYGIELDVYGIDGERFVFHDRYLERLTATPGRLKDLSAEQIKHLKIFGQQPIPTLRDALKHINGHCHVNIELKGDIPTRELLKDVDFALTNTSFSQEQLLFSSFNHHWLQRLKKRRPDALIGALSASCPLTYCQFAEDLNAYSAHFAVDFVTKELVEDGHERGLQVYVYTVDERHDIEELHEMGVDGIFTNHPSFAQNVIAGLTTAGNDPILHY